MYCKNCGGKLLAKESYFICENCHGKFECASLYGNDEVFIANVETDEYGRRTKDSIIAQEIYHRLEQANIKTFFQRISASDITDDAIESICAAAAENAKIIMIVGTSSERFEDLLNKYQNMMQTKSIIPVFSGIQPIALPQKIKNLQGLSYDVVGAREDLIKNTLHILKRDEEIELFNPKNYSMKKKKRRVIITAISAVLICSFTYLITCTPYFLKSKKYEYANDLVARKSYVQAIHTLCNIRDYKDSETLLQDVYKLYSGTYTDKDGNFILRLKINDAYSANIKVMRNLGNDSMSIFNENVEIDKNAIRCSFKDNTGMSGECSIMFENGGIQVTLYRIPNNEKVEDINIFISFESKLEEDLFLKVSREQLLSWLDGSTTINKIIGKGYDIEASGNNGYKIKNTDILISCNSEGVVKSVTGLADVLCPEYVNQEAIPYYQEDILYCPNSELFWTKNTTGEVITDSSVITMATKQSLGKEWKNIKENLDYATHPDENDVNFDYLPIGKLKLGMTTREVQRILGDAEEKKQEIAQMATGESIQIWNYPSKGIEIAFVRDNRSDQIISNICIKSPCDFATPQGIGIGSSRNDVISAYNGKIDEEMSNNRIIIIGSIYGGTVFSMENDKVSEIFVGASAY